MNKLKKMLLISSLLVLSSCAKNGLPESPDAERIVPIWTTVNEQPVVTQFYGKWMKSGAKIEMPLHDARAQQLQCTTLASYNLQELYIKELEKLLEKAQKQCPNLKL